MTKMKVTGVRGSDEVLRPRPTVAELQSLLSPSGLEDRLRALVVVWRGRASIYQAEGERLLDASRFIVNRVNAFARRDEWLQASRDLEAILDAFAKEQVDGHAAAEK